MIRRQGQHPEQRADDVRRARRPEERGVAAVVLDDEQTDEEEGGGYGQEEGEPVADAQARVHQRPGAGEQRRRAGELPHAPLELRTLVARQARRPCRFVRHCLLGSGVSQANGAGGGSQTAADARPRVRLISLGPQGRLSMAPVTIARFVQELEKLKQVADAEKLKPPEYDSRLARIIQELREKGIDADRAATTAALADAVKRGIITLPVQAHLQRRLGLT